MKYTALTAIIILFCFGSPVWAQNNPPEISVFNDTTVAEGDTLLLHITATDADGDSLILFVSLPPENAIFFDSGNGAASLEFTPDFTQEGQFGLRFFVTDEIDTAFFDFVITVTNTNLIPVIDPVADTSVLEGVLLEIIVTASDPDGTIPSLLAETLPTDADFTDNSDGTGLFSFRPLLSQMGDHIITFLAADDEDTASTQMTITVDGPNEPPVLNPIPDTTITEGETLILLLTSSDPNGTFPGINMSFEPQNATLDDHGDGTATFTFIPSYIQGTPTPYNILFDANDGKQSVNQNVSITVLDAGNQPPVFDPVPDTSILEGEVLTLPIAATDPDGLVDSLVTSALPTNAVLTDTASGTGTGTFIFIPDESQLGNHLITFIAGDDSGAVATMPVNIIVTGPNLPPVFGPLEDTMRVTEGDTISFTVSATDPNSTIPVITVSPLPAFAEFADSSFGSGEFMATPGFVDSGTYAITFTASDFKPTNESTFELILIVEDAGNQKPIIAPIIPPDPIFEGGHLSFAIGANDPDQDTTTPLIFTVSELENVVLVDNEDGTAQFDFSPDCNQGSSVNGDSLHLISFYATDGGLTDTVMVEIIVVDTGNWLPSWETIGSQNIDEGRYLDMIVTALDCEDGTLFLSTGSLPYNARFSDLGDGTGRFEFYPGYSQAEAYLIDFYAFDGEVTDSAQISITVNDVAGNVANDPGASDTLRLIGSAWDGSPPGFSISCRISIDSAVAGASTGFKWEESWLTLDTVELEPWVETAFYSNVFVDSALQLFHIGFIFYDSLSIDSGNHAYFMARFTYDSASVDIDTLWDISSRIHIDTAKVGNSGDFVLDPVLKGSPPEKMTRPDFDLALSTKTYAPLIRLQEVREAHDVVDVSVYDVVNQRRLLADDTIWVDGEELSYLLQISLENRDSLDEISLGLVLSSDNGAGWTWLPQVDGIGNLTSAAFLPDGGRLRDHNTIWPASGGLQMVETNMDGSAADSLILTGSAGGAVGAGLRAGLTDHVVSLAFIPQNPLDSSIGTLCLDKVADGPDWTFTPLDSTSKTPDFSGRLCFPVASLNGTATGDIPGQLPRVNRLYQNRPNPFNPTTSIDFSLARRSRVRVIVFNILGQNVKTLTDRVYSPGEHTVTWDGRNNEGRSAASGIYLYRITTEGFNKTRKMILLR